jgi:serine/threonine protein kinase
MAAFYTAEIVLALEYLHKHMIIHRYSRIQCSRW